MSVLRRVVFILLTVGIVWSFAPAGIANPAVTYKDCPATSPSPSPTPAVSPPVSPPPPPTTSPGPTPTPTPPPDDCMPTSGSVLRDTRTIAFTVGSDGFQPIKSVQVTVLADNDKGAQDAAQPLFNAAYNCNNQPNPQKPILVPWDTNTDTPHNGKYEVVISAVAYGDPTCSGTGHSTTPKPRNDLLVDNYPAAVAAPHIIATTSSTITIGWDASTAPDAMRYEVYRAVTSSSKDKPKEFQPWGYSTSTTFRDQQVSPGTYWYEVVVSRRSVVSKDGLISGPPSDPSPPVTIAAAPVIFKSGPPQASVRRYIPLNPIILPPSQSFAPAPVPDAPYSAQLPYGNVPEGGAGAVTGGGGKTSGGGATDPRGPVLPVAVGAFLVSAALALGRMPY